MIRGRGSYAGAADRTFGWTFLDPVTLCLCFTGQGLPCYLADLHNTPGTKGSSWLSRWKSTKSIS